MSKVADEALSDNRDYAQDFGKIGKLPLARRFASPTRVNARFHPAK